MAQLLRRRGPALLSIRVHFNQLALFTDDPVESAAVQTAEVAHEGHDGEDDARGSDPESLAGALSADGAEPGGAEPFGPGGVRNPDPDGRPALRAGVGEEDGLSRGVGTGAGGMGAAGRGERGNGQQPAGDTGVREAGAPKIEVSEIQFTELHAGDIEPEAAARPPPRDFRISEAHRIGQGGLKEKARDNIAAIRTLRLVEDEGREAREPEKAVLARYSGWGALSNVFHPYPDRKSTRLNSSH